jgi:hypothetical protein
MYHIGKLVQVKIHALIRFTSAIWLSHTNLRMFPGLNVNKHFTSIA